MLFWPVRERCHPAFPPSEARILHNTGELDANEQDAGIAILPDDRAFAIAISTSGDNVAGIKVIRRAAELSHESFSEADR